LLPSADGRRLLHASGFLADTEASQPEDAARSFLSTHGPAFGITKRQALVSKGTPAIGEVGAVHFERTIDGLPIFGGDLVVGVDAQSRVFIVNAGDVPPVVSGRHAIGEAAARSAAVLSFGGSLRGAGAANVALGWRTFGPSVRAVYRVDFIAKDPPGDWRVFVDGETGKPLFRENLRYYASAQGSIFEVSPVETAASACPLSGTGHSFCASPVSVTIPNLSTGSDLTGTQTTVYNCKGANAPTSIPGTCTSVPAVSGAFNFAVDSTYKVTTDDFAAAMAYYHLDKHVSFFKRLDPTLPAGTGRAVRASLPAVVNSFEGGATLENAFFSGALDAMVFGQGANADFAYDATVMYHEFTHGVVSAWGGFNPTIDSLGGLDEPGAVNEGTADAMAVSENGRSQVGSFITATGFPPSSPPTPFLRDMNDPNASRACQGDGTLVTKLGGLTALNGLDGEVHDDGEIWNGFYWEVYQGLKAAGIKACSGSCDAGPALQYKALQLAAGTHPSFNSYWQTLKAGASALFPTQSGVVGYVDCVAKRRKLDKCDRTVPVYAGERKGQFIRLRFSPFQVALPATGPTQFSVCSLNGTTTTVYARMGLPAQITAIDPSTGVATVTADGSATFSQACSGGLVATFSLSPAGTWYLLFDSPNALSGATPGSDIYRIDVSQTGMASRPASTAPASCAPPFLSITPRSASVSPRGQMVFTATGGSGSGYSWSFGTNNSGGSMNASTGAYTAGPTGSVTDTVKVTDSLGNTATGNITVTAGVSISPAAPSPPPKGTLSFTASGGSGTGFTWSLTTNSSGGSINASTGAYTAGPTGSVADTVKVTDSLGNTATGNITVTAGVSILPAAPSTPPKGTLSFTASGGSATGFTWSLTTNSSDGSINASTGAYTAGPTGSVADTVKVTDSLGNTATGNITVTAGVSILPAAPSTPAKGTLSFTASGGSATGFTWSLTTNSSGGSINASTGAYTAGPTGSVTDTVKVTDSLGNTATGNITVTASSPSGGGGGCSTSGTAAPSILMLGLAVLLHRRRRGVRQARGQGDG
jgi:uncharacterized protein (TIGR03382 family)